MVEDKVGTKPYLGIQIDYDKEKKLDATLKEILTEKQQKKWIKYKETLKRK